MFSEAAKKKFEHNIYPYSILSYRTAYCVNHINHGDSMKQKALEKDNV